MVISTDILRNDAIEWLIESLGTDEPEVLLDVIETFRMDGLNILNRMRDAIAQDDEQALFRSAHTLKSSSSIVGAEYLSSICENLEISLRKKQPVNFSEAFQKISDAFFEVDQLLIIEIEKLKN